MAARAKTKRPRSAHGDISHSRILAKTILELDPRIAFTRLGYYYISPCLIGRFGVSSPNLGTEMGHAWDLAGVFMLDYLWEPKAAHCPILRYHYRDCSHRSSRTSLLPRLNTYGDVSSRRCCKHGNDAPLSSYNPCLFVLLALSTSHSAASDSLKPGQKPATPKFGPLYTTDSCSSFPFCCQAHPGTSNHPPSTQRLSLCVSRHL